MERLLTCLIAAGSLFLTVRGEVFKGDCNFERPYTACGYSQGKDDHFDWEQANTKERPSPNPWMPTGSAFMMVNTSGRSSGQKAQLLMPQLKENDTHCLIFQYYMAGQREGANPGQLNIYIKENNSPLGIPVWNASGPAYPTWRQVELAVSTFWPNFYQRHWAREITSICSTEALGQRNHLHLFHRGTGPEKSPPSVPQRHWAEGDSLSLDSAIQRNDTEHNLRGM